MRIAVDVSPLSVPLTGIGYYIRETTAALAAVAPQHEVVAVALVHPREAARLRERLAPLPPAVVRRIRTLPFAPKWRRVANHLPLPTLELLAGRCGAFVGSEWLYPRQRRGVRVAVVHDLIPLRHPEWTTPPTRRMHVRKLADTRRADVVVCNSETTARDVVDLAGVAPARVHVARPGVAARFRDARPATPPPCGGRPYVVSVCTREPRKNLATLLDAFALARREQPDLALLLVGGRGWGRDEVAERVAALGLERDVEIAGYVEEERVPGLVAGARTFCWPALFEGFGMPVTEALAAGVPVVCSDDASLDEAAGDAALRVPARDASALAAALATACADGPERDARIARGRAHTAGLTWEATAGVFVTAIEEAAA
jgi:glycosyltransferase involved in cell wall biosynthesis